MSLLFFAGLPNAIQINLMPVVLWAVFEKGGVPAGERKKSLSSG